MKGRGDWGMSFSHTLTAGSLLAMTHTMAIVLDIKNNIGNSLLFPFYKWYLLIQACYLIHNDFYNQ